MSIDAEIAEQPDAVSRAIAAAKRAGPAITGRLAQDGGVTHVLIAARGTSDNAAVFAQYLWGRHLRLPVALTTPSLFTGDAPPLLRGALVVGVSQSGASPDLVGVLEEARRQHRPTIALTNQPDSPLAAAGDVVVGLEVGVEQAVAATKTYTGQLAALAVLTDALRPALGVPATPTVGARVDAMPDALASVLAADPLTSPFLELLAAGDRVAIVGRGLDLATAREWSLKLQELSGVLAHPWSTADFRHGPFALAASGLPVVVVSTDDRHVAEARALTADLVAANATTVLLTDQPPSDPDHPVVALPAADPVIGPATGIVAAQLATVALTRVRGRDPDDPPLLRKVTRTR